MGDVVAPSRAPGRRPLVLFLHGRHSHLLQQPGRHRQLAVPARLEADRQPRRAYRYLQHMLASQGYVTVSSPPTASTARTTQSTTAARRHVTSWCVTTSPCSRPGRRARATSSAVACPAASTWRRCCWSGTAAAARAPTAPCSTPRAPTHDAHRRWGLIAPTAFGRQIAPGIPTSVLLPYCDGDVSDLEGQVFIDAARRPALRGQRSEVRGARDGRRPSSSTPSGPPASRRHRRSTTGATLPTPYCGTKAAQRLTGGGQRAVARAYIGAAARTYLASKPLLSRSSTVARSGPSQPVRPWS